MLIEREWYDPETAFSHLQEFFFNGEALGNAFVHQMELGTHLLSPVVGIKGDQTKVTLLPEQSFSSAGLSSQRAISNLTISMDALKRIDAYQELPTSFVSLVFSYWKRWKKGREYWVKLKSGVDITVDISEEGCKGMF